MHIVMIGAGYVGLTTGACLAELGHDVVCVDQDAERVALLEGGGIPIYEPGLAEIVASNRAAGRLAFSADAPSAVGGADAVFLAVGTPSDAEGDIDLTFIDRAARDIAPVLRPNCVVVVKSTVVVGTCRILREAIAEERGGLDFSVASNPEFLREGSAVADFLAPDRVIVGFDDPRARSVLEAIYAPLADRGVPILCTSNANAELIKYAANAFLALKIGFINDVANLCEKTGGDVGMVAAGIGMDPRIGPHFLQAGPGFGGSCFPKDTRAFAATGRRFAAPQPLIEALVAGNDERRRTLADRILAELGDHGKGAVVGVLGLAFKANTDDVRESASLAIIPMLQEAGCTVRAHDPKAAGEAARRLSNVAYAGDAYEAAEGADILVVMTEWSDYRDLDLSRIASLMRGNTLIDYRNLWSPQSVADRGLRYLSLGRPAGGELRSSAAIAGKPPRPAGRAAGRSPS